MNVRLERQYRSDSEADRVWRSVAADNPAHVWGKVTGGRLTIEVSSSSAASLRMTLDDLIACLAAAEKAGEAAGASARPKGTTAPVERGQNSK